MLRQILNQHSVMDRIPATRAAFGIFDAVQGRKSARVLRLMLEVCRESEQADQELSVVWSAVVAQREVRLYPLVLRSCRTLPAALSCLSRMRWSRTEHGEGAHRACSKGVAALIARCASPEQLEALHALLAERDEIATDMFVQSALVDAFAKCTAPAGLERSLRVFAAIDAAQHSAVSVGSMLRLLMRHECHARALALYDRYAHLCDAVSHALALRACASAKWRSRGLRIVESLRLENTDIRLKNAVLSFFAEFGDVESARDAMHCNDDVDAAAIANLMKAHLRRNDAGDAEAALAVFDGAAAAHRDAVSTMFALRCCSVLRRFERGKRIIADSPPGTFRASHHSAQRIAFHGESGDVAAAMRVFEALSSCDRNRDALALNAAMSALMKNGDDAAALALFEGGAGAKDAVSALFAVKACSSGGSIDLERVHALIRRRGAEWLSVEVGNALIRLYGAAKDALSARAVWSELGDAQRRDGGSLSALMAALIANARGHEALALYDAHCDLHSDAAHALAIKGCAGGGGQEMWRARRIAREHESKRAENALMHVLGESGDVAGARDVLEAMGAKGCADAVSVGAMLEALCSNHAHAECLALFDAAQARFGVAPDEDRVCTAIALEAAARASALGFALKLRRKLSARRSQLLRIAHIQCKLLKIFAKCGMLALCRELFAEIEAMCGAEGVAPEVRSAMIGALAQNGAARDARALFDAIASPSTLELSALMCALSHCGEASEALRIWKRIERDEQRMDCRVVTSLVDGLARAAMFGEALGVALRYPVGAETKTMWLALLSGCRNHQERDMARTVYAAMRERFQGDADLMDSAQVLMKHIQHACGDVSVSDQCRRHTSSSTA